MKRGERGEGTKSSDRGGRFYYVILLMHSKAGDRRASNAPRKKYYVFTVRKSTMKTFYAFLLRVRLQNFTYARSRPRNEQRNSLNEVDNNEGKS